ncbi:ABC transporter substrate-binding protein [Halostreptopolyspora alba]|uniref:Nitrate ABC transporter substrate-binding protein n=1 Tax=Halostreptopolyspora alba TaxID=2487137 RepID=A0A3N0EE05_9ACTN|nr:nitrate ABC transporter substrate-binding protein [Nocardiopsaceae bacterium YIM 96095]
MNRKILAAAGVAVLASTTACGGEGDNELTSVTVGALPIVDTAPIHLGVEQGFFEDEGLDVTVENTTGGAQAVPSVASGEFDFAFGNITSLILAREEGLPMTIVSNGVTTTGKDGEDFGAVVVPEGSDISSPADLAGADVAVNNLQNIGDTTVRNSVREDGGAPEDVSFAEMPFPDMPAALANGEVDAAWVVEPFLTMTLEDGAEEIASNFVDTHESLSVASYFTSEEVVAEEPEMVESFGAAMTESMNYADDNPDEVRRILPTYTEMDEGIIDEIRLPAFPAAPDEESATVVGELMLEDGLIEEEADIDGLFRETQ